MRSDHVTLPAGNVLDAVLILSHLLSCPATAEQIERALCAAGFEGGFIRETYETLHAATGRPPRLKRV